MNPYSLAEFAVYLACSLSILLLFGLALLARAPVLAVLFLAWFVFFVSWTWYLVDRRVVAEALADQLRAQGDGP